MRRLPLLPLFVLALGLACSGDLTPPERGEARLALRVDLATAAATAANVAVWVSGPGIDGDIVHNLTLSEGVATGALEVPAGAARRFVVRVFDASAVATHEGEEVADVRASGNAPLTITLHPLMGDQELTATVSGYVLTLSPAAAEVKVGEGVTFEAALVGVDGEAVPEPELHWSLENPAVASLDTGTAVGRVGGTTGVMVRWNGLAATAALTVHVQNEAALSLTGSAAPSATGEPATASVMVSNAGPLDAPGVVVTLSLPGDNYDLTPSQGACEIEERVATCALGALAADAHATITLGFSPTAPGTTVVTGSVAGDLPDPDATDDTLALDLVAEGCWIVEIDSNTEGVMDGIQGETRCFEFDAAEGDRINAAFHARGLNDRFHMRLYDPAGATLYEKREEWYFQTWGLVDTGVRELTMAGRYRLEFESVDGSAGAFTVGIARIEDPIPVELTGAETTVAGELTIVGDRQYYSVPLGAQTAPTLVLRSIAEAAQYNSSGIKPWAGLRAPHENFWAGSLRDEIGLTLFGDRREDESGHVFIATAGQYILEARNNQGDAVLGKYELTLVNPPAHAPAWNEAVQGDTDIWYRNHLYRLGPTGDHPLYLLRVRDAGPGYLYAHLYQRDGSVTKSPRLGGNHPSNPWTWEYGPLEMMPDSQWLVLDPPRSASPAFDVALVGIDPPTPLDPAAAPYDERIDAIEVPSGRRYFSLAAQAGQVVSVEVQAVAGTVAGEPAPERLTGSLSVKRADADTFWGGATVQDPVFGASAASFGPGDPGEVVFTAPETREYVVAVDPVTTGAGATGAFRLRASVLDAASTIVVGDASCVGAETASLPAAAAAVEDHGTIQVCAGELNVNRPAFIVAPGVRLTGAGVDETSLLPPVRDGYVAPIRVRAADFSLSDLTVRVGDHMTSHPRRFARGVWLEAGSDGASFQRCALTDGETPAAKRLGIASEVAVQGVVVSECRFDLTVPWDSYNDRPEPNTAGVWLVGEDHQVTESEFGSRGGLTYYGVRIEGDRAVVSDNRAVPQAGAGAAAFTVIQVTGDAATVERNVIGDGQYRGIVVHEGSTATIRFNTIGSAGMGYYLYTRGIYVLNIPAAVVERNEVTAGAHQYAGVYLWNAGGRVANNLIRMGELYGLVYDHNEGVAHPAAFLNNTVVIDKPRVRRSAGISLSGTGSAVPVVVANNIFWAPGTAGDNTYGIQAVDGVALDAADHNLVHGFEIQYGGIQPGPGDLGVNPLLDADLSPLAGSPVLDAGTGTHCTAEDFTGAPRPADGDGDGAAACDVGAWERQVP